MFPANVSQLSVIPQPSTKPFLIATSMTVATSRDLHDIVRKSVIMQEGTVAIIRTP